ncbi:MAG: zinc-ribbon domain-containing protein, partial [Ruminococcaceae bacterium]|nr:zinc-ribbon domain-containing protein [Oscillospiraceae bacterium]
ARGDDVRITDADLTIVRQYNQQKRCRNCGYETTEDFDFCPKCGEKL